MNIEKYTILILTLLSLVFNLNGQGASHLLKGFIHESHPIELSYTSDNSNLTGILKYPDSGLQFELEGIAINDTLLFVETDPEFGISGNIKLIKESNQYIGFWTDKDKSRFFQIQLSKSGIKRPQNLEIFRGKLIDDNIRFFYHANGAYLNGKVYNEGSKTTLDFNGKFTSSDGSNYTGVLWERGIYKGKMNIRKSEMGDLQVSFLSEEGVSQFVIFQKVGEIELEHIQSFGYDHYSDFIRLQDMVGPWDNNFVHYKPHKKDSFSPVDRSTEVVDGWIDFHHISHTLISGIYQIESIQNSDLSFSFSINRNKNQLLNLETFFKNPDWKSWCEKLIEKDFPGKLKKGNWLYSWYKEGLRVSSEYDPEEGFSYVVIPRKDIDPILSKYAQKLLK